MRDREMTFELIERIAMGFTDTGKVDEWFGGCDPIVRAVRKGVNGLLWEHLAQSASYHEKKAANDQHATCDWQRGPDRPAKLLPKEKRAPELVR